MNRRTAKKRTRVARRRALAELGRELDRHDRAYLLAFMRGCVEHLAREGGVDQKVHVVAAIARRLAPAVAARREKGGRRA